MSKQQSTKTRPPATSQAAVLRATGLTKQYSELTVLDSIDLTVHAGSVTALIGPNGTGKTTLLRLLLGHLEPTAGDVEYAGPAVERPIGYLPQQPAFRPHFTVEETISFYASLLETATDTEELLTQVDLYDVRNRPVEALSGGMTRLLGIAQSVVGDPPAVIFDEPASGLDPTMGTKAFEITAQLADRGTAVIVSSHDLALVERYADTVILLHDKQIAAQGPPQQLCQTHNVTDLWEVYDAVTATDTPQTNTEVTQ